MLLQYQTYAIINVVGENNFELSIPLFLGLHVVFNLELLQPYFLLLFDITEDTEKFPPHKTQS